MTRRHVSRLIVILPLLLVSCGGQPNLLQSTLQPTALIQHVVQSAGSKPTAVATHTAVIVPTAATATLSAIDASTTATIDTSPDDEATRLAVQATVEQWSAAYNDQSVDELRLAIDPKNLAFRRTQESRLRQYNVSELAGTTTFQGTIQDIVPLNDGYLRATVDFGGWLRPWTFRHVGDKWLLSEPRRSELGKPLTRATEHFTVRYYAWDADVIGPLAQIFERAYTSDVHVMGRGPERKTLVDIIPTTELMPGGANGWVAGRYIPGHKSTDGLPMVWMSAPLSFSFGGFDTYGGWQPTARSLFAHEFAHLITDCCFVPIVHLSSWMSEGIATYVAGQTYHNTVRYAVKHDALIPIKAPPDAPGAIPEDLEYLTTLKHDVTLGYGEAYSLVAYIVDHFGGIEGFWKLAEDYNQTQDINASLKHVFGISLAEFDRGWRAALKEQYDN